MISRVTVYAMTEQTWRHANIKKAQEARSRTAEDGWANRLRRRGWFCARTGEPMVPALDMQIFATNGMGETYRVDGWTDTGKPLLIGKEGNVFLGVFDYLFTVGPK